MQLCQEEKHGVYSSSTAATQMGNNFSGHPAVSDKSIYQIVQFFSTVLKGQGHVTVNQPIISIIYIVAHTWPLCSAHILVDGVNPLESYFRKSTNISAILQHMSVSFVSL